MDVHQDDDDTISTKDEFLLTTDDHDDKSTGATTTAERQIQDMMIEYNHRVNLIIPEKSQSNRRIGKNFVSFTDKLYLILKIAPKYNLDVYVSWAIHGWCFYIHNREMFLHTIGTQ
jgi:hypothetical protein